jgi:hypothetical protein
MDRTIHSSAIHRQNDPSKERSIDNPFIDDPSTERSIDNPFIDDPFIDDPFIDDHRQNDPLTERCQIPKRPTIEVSGNPNPRNWRLQNERHRTKKNYPPSEHQGSNQQAPKYPSARKYPSDKVSKLASI